MDGYINIDLDPLDSRVVKMDILDLQYDEGSVDEIVAKDILEHLPLNKAKEAVSHWGKFLKSGGQLFIQTTNFAKIIEAYRQGVWNISSLCYMLFAGRNWVSGNSQDADWHKSTYDIPTLTSWLESSGMRVIKFSEDNVDDALRANPYCHNLNLSIWAVKN